MAPMRGSLKGNVSMCPLWGPNYTFNCVLDKGASSEWRWRRTIHRAPRVFKDSDPFVKLQFVELMCSAQMGRVIRMELLATSG